MQIAKVKSALSLWLTPIAISLGVSALLIIGSRLVDFWLFAPVGGPWFSNWMLPRNAALVRETIQAVLQTLAGVFAISITVVAIIVQLAATRYTSRVVDLFLTDINNILIFFIYVVPLVYGMWLSNVLDEHDYSRLTVGLFTLLSTVATVVVIPYFTFVFRFLQPNNIIEKIERAVERGLQTARANPAQLTPIRADVSNSLRQLGDIALSSVGQSDIVLAMDSLNSIKNVGLYYLTIKERLPDAWFEIDSNHIVGLSEEMWESIVRNRTWLEMEVFKQFEAAYTNSLGKVRDVTGFVARAMREIAERAALEQDDRTLDFYIKGFNTLINYALSERDIRTCVNVLYQYRLLAEALLYRPELLERIAIHLKYYGHNSQRRRIYFIMDAVGYDLRMLIETSLKHFPEHVDRLLAVFLQLDQAANSKEDYTYLRGVRQSQAMLAGFFIRNGRMDLAKRIMDDMAEESEEFLRVIRRDLFATQSREFWEIEDRGVSFYYVDPEERPGVELFFSWLLKEQPLPQDLAQSA